MILFSGIILTADGVADIVFLIMIRRWNEKIRKLCAEKEQEENAKRNHGMTRQMQVWTKKCRINL